MRVTFEEARENSPISPLLMLGASVDERARVEERAIVDHGVDVVGGAEHALGALRIRELVATGQVERLEHVGNRRTRDDLDRLGGALAADELDGDGLEGSI